MKTPALVLLASLFLNAAAFCHGDLKIGPNGGRLVSLGEKNPLHAEFVLKGEQFVVSLYDEAAKKEVPLAEQELAVTHKESKKKLTAELKDGKWTLEKPAGDDFWLIVQVREKAGAKPLNGRLHYDAAKCPTCKDPEWLCRCQEDAAKKE